MTIESLLWALLSEEKIGSSGENSRFRTNSQDTIRSSSESHTIGQWWKTCQFRDVEVLQAKRNPSSAVLKINCYPRGYAFYESLDKTYGECPKYDAKIVIGDANGQVGREDFFRPIIGTESLHLVTNDNGLRLVNFAATISSTYFTRKNIHKHTWRH